MLKKIRESKNISQAKLAKLSGLSLSLICIYEQKPDKIKKAKYETLYKIAKVLDCTVCDLLQGL